MIIVGIDPSLSNFGLAKGVYHESDASFVLTDLHLETTQPKSKNNKQVRVNSHDLHRARSLHKATQSFISNADMLMVEIPVGSQSARSMASYGICIGLLASFAKPMIQVSPDEVKLASVGSKTASKASIIEWALDQHPDGDWLTHKRNGISEVTAKNEHLADALAAIYAGIASDTFQQLLAFQRNAI